ncbi:MAG TPA: YncE family protein [Usitatibacter sp.]|jgi:DNA-binding beta-propeller fold protein YncE|nr:YncE family protein [Usitatibacter sp.]
MKTQALRFIQCGALAMCLGAAALPAAAQHIIVGIDNKVFWDAEGKQGFYAPGKDAVLVLDIANRENPRVVGTLPLMNSVFGPPVNLAITPDGGLALVANSFDWVQDGAAWKNVPSADIFVIDLKASPPALVATVKGGKQPSGMAINKAGNMALVANRADNSVTVLSIDGKDVKVTDTIAMGEQVSAVAFTPDGKRALAAKNVNNKAALLEIDGGKVAYNKYDMLVGLFPYNIAITPNGKLGLTANNGATGSADGNIDTVGVIDMEATPPRLIDAVVVGDGPEGFAVSPNGDVAVAILLRGSNAKQSAFFYNRNGSVAVLKIDGKKVTKVGDVEVRGLPEGAAFSPDGKYLYVGNYMDDDISILKVDGTNITNTGKSVKLPGHPASLRSVVP